jgi:hypothetical protein
MSNFNYPTKALNQSLFSIMKQLLFTLIIFASSAAFGQLSLSLGYMKLREKVSYDKFSFQTDYDFKKYRIYSELGYFSDKIEYQDQWEENGFGYSLEYINRFSKINYSYGTFKLGIGKQFKATYKTKFWNAFSFNIFGQYDRVFGLKIYDQVTYRKTTTYEDYDPSGNLIMTVKSFPTDYSPFEVGTIRKNILRVGFDVKLRFGYENLFLELSTSLVSPVTDRVTLISHKVNSYGLDQGLFYPLFITGIKIGYIFPIKEKPTINP